MHYTRLCSQSWSFGFISSLKVDFPLLGNSDHAVVSILIKFPVSHYLWLLSYWFGWFSWSYQKCSIGWCIWSGCFCYYSGITSWELVYLSRIESTRLSCIRHHCFHLLVLLPLFIETTSFVFTNGTDMRLNWDRQ